MRVDAKIQARQWLLNAIQNHSCIPNKEAEREIRKFVVRLQRDLENLRRSRELFKLANPGMDGPVIYPAPQRRVKKSKKQRRQEKTDMIRLMREQWKDAHDQRMRFEHAIGKD